MRPATISEAEDFEIAPGAELFDARTPADAGRSAGRARLHRSCRWRSTRPCPGSTGEVASLYSALAAAGHRPVAADYSVEAQPADERVGPAARRRAVGAPAAGGRLEDLRPRRATHRVRPDLLPRRPLPLPQPADGRAAGAGLVRPRAAGLRPRRPARPSGTLGQNSRLVDQLVLAGSIPGHAETPSGSTRAPGDPASHVRRGRPCIRRRDTAHHVWGDAESGHVTDRVYVSTSALHVLEFELAPGGGFRHSPTNKTVFAADVFYCVLDGTLVHRGPGARRGAGRRGRRGRPVPPRHLAPRVQPRRGHAASAGVLRPAAEQGHRVDLRREPGRPGVRCGTTTSAGSAAGRWRPRSEQARLEAARRAGDRRRCGGSPTRPRRTCRARSSTPSTCVVRTGRVAAGHVEDLHEVEDETVLVVTSGQLWVDTQDPARRLRRRVPRARRRRVRAGGQQPSSPGPVRGSGDVPLGRRAADA